MEDALEVRKGKERLVSAFAVQSEFHGRTPWGVSYICPICRQPLIPAAMLPGSLQSPHFRHERNNERARECERFASAYGFFMAYQRAPMPMFIRKSRSQSGRFIVEAGFRKLDPWSFKTLESEGAVIAISQKRYRVTPQRFNGGLTKLPLEELSLSCGSSLRLVSTSLSLDATWGRLEDASHAMVFSRDVDSGQGKRFNKGDVLVFEADYYLLAPDRESDAIERAFPDSRRVGYAGSRTTELNLAVFEITPSKANANWFAAKQYLEGCGFEIADFGDTPELLWPPSLKSGGDIVPLFTYSRSIFEADLRSSDEGKLFIHTNASTADHVRDIPLKEAGGSGHGFAVLDDTANLSLVTTRNWIFSSAALLHPDGAAIAEWLHAGHLSQVEHALNDDGALKLLFNVPGSIVLMRKGTPPQRHKAEGETREFIISARDADMLRVLLSLGASLDENCVYEHEFRRQAKSEDVSAPKPRRLAMGATLLPHDVQRAINRRMRSKTLPGESATKRIAKARRRPDDE